MLNPLHPELVTALENYKKAHAELAGAWQEHDHTGEYFITKYPFSKSFDDLYTEVAAWVDYSLLSPDITDEVKAKKFLYKDKSGRGVTNKLTGEDLLGQDNDEDWNGKMLHEFVLEAEEGDSWEDAATLYTCI